MEPVSIIEALELIYAMYREVAATYSTYKRVATTATDLYDYYNAGDNAHTLIIGEDVYLYLLGRAVLRRSRALGTFPDDQIADIIYATIADSHAKGRNPDIRFSLVQFLIMLGVNIQRADSYFLRRLRRAMANAPSRIDVNDPLISFLNKNTLSADPFEQMGMQPHDKRYISILSGGEDAAAIFRTFSEMITMPGVLDNYNRLIKETISKKGSIPFARTPIGLVLQGAESAAVGQTDEIIVGAPLEGRRGTPVSLGILMPLAEQAIHRPLTPFEAPPSGITSDLVRAMSARVTKTIGYVKTENNSFYPLEQVVAVPLSKDGKNTVEYVIMTDDPKGRSPWAVFVDELQSHVVSRVQARATSRVRASDDRTSRVHNDNKPGPQRNQTD